MNVSDVIDQAEEAELDADRDGDDERGGPSDTRADRRRRRGLLALLVLALVAGCVVLGLAWRDAAGDADRLTQAADLRSSAAKAAETYAVDLTTYDYKSLADQQEKLAGESTERFQANFTDSMGTLGPIFEELQATADGSVVQIAVVEATDKKATVIAFVDQVANSTEMKEPQTQASRLTMTLVRHGDQWLLDSVDLV